MVSMDQIARRDRYRRRRGDDLLPDRSGDEESPIQRKDEKYVNKTPVHLFLRLPAIRILIKNTNSTDNEYYAIILVNRSRVGMKMPALQEVSCPPRALCVRSRLSCSLH